jgi:hypothetical protein
MTTKQGQQSFDINSWIETLKRCEYIKESEVKALCGRAKEILSQENNVQVVESPVTVSILSQIETRFAATSTASSTT